ncbi:MAG: DUF2723 domain-containing protein [Chlorobi bacterium]|nr:DUF2723 domain-containing protein [Chlorobiota bacterium]
MKYQKLNIIFGWIIFAIAAYTYLSTIEPTASFWDCGEFIAASYKLEVCHPPGAPLFMILGRIVSLFASDPSHVAMMINSLSAIASALTILFLFWTITNLAKRFFAKNEKLSTGQIIAILGSGAVGALAYTFSDTFWFSAVEGEVYATSSLFTAIVFWAILKWEKVADEPYANRWIILIAYLMGLSIGVHLLNLLAIPAIVFVYYFKKYKVTRNGIISASLISIVLLGTIMYVIINGTVKFATFFELFFVNVIGLPYHSGNIIYALLIIGFISWGIYYTHKKRKVLLNTILLGLAVILIGYSSYALIVIRSLANPPMDQNNPENVFNLLSYLNREQYGDRPLLYGEYFNAPLDRSNPYGTGTKYYIKKNGKYVVSYSSQKYNYDPRFKTIFPRMYSPQSNHIKAYKEWTNFKGTPIKITNNQGEQETVYKPTFVDNIEFFIKYQLGHMYFRYFMWNFSGRQNNIQGHGELSNGNWLTGINFIDDMRLGSQENLPYSLKSNKARNKYYLLPLLLGLIGLFYHAKIKPLDFSVVMLLFFFTGIAIVIYLNQYPYQPRERDYAYAGSFYAFAIWIGVGIVSLYEIISNKIPGVAKASIITLAGLLLVPVIMAKENWDDHDRSNRYMVRDFASDYLNSCDPNAVIFTNGDNDTFPLWYAQEVEGIRTDVRIICLPYLSTDWYINQMKRKVYESEPVPFSLNYNQYMMGKRDLVPVYERLKESVSLKELIEFVGSDNPKTKLRTNSGDEMDYMPARNFIIPVDKNKVLNNSIVAQDDSNLIVDNVKWKLSTNYLHKNDLMMLDLLASANWDRPIYYVTVGHGNETNLKNYFQLDGFASKFVPIKTKFSENRVGHINTKSLYDKLMNTFKWGNISDTNIYIDETTSRTTKILKLRENFANLAMALYDKNEKDSARMVLERCKELFPQKQMPFSIYDFSLGEAYYYTQNNEMGDEFIKDYSKTIISELKYYYSQKGRFKNSFTAEKQTNLAILKELTRLTSNYNRTELNKSLEEDFSNYYSMFIGQQTLK